MNITLIKVKAGLLPATYSVGGVYMSGLDQSKVGPTEVKWKSSARNLASEHQHVTSSHFWSFVD